MKKLLSLVLICAMGFGMISCVESEESPSVTAIRNAKAEQLKALTNLYNAQAQAELIIAEAEAALKAAEAEYQKLMTEQAKEIFAAELAKIKAEAEAALWDAKMKAAEYEQYIFETAEAKIQTLYLNYATALDELSLAKNDLIVAKANMALLEANADYATENAEEEIAYYNRMIAGLEAQIEVYKDPKYTSINKDSLWVLYREAYQEQQLAKKAYQYNEEKAANEAKAAAIITANKFHNEIDEVNDVYDGENLIEKHYGNSLWLRGSINTETGHANNWYEQANVVSVTLNEDVLVKAQRNAKSTYEEYVKYVGTETDKFDYENEPWNASMWAKFNYAQEQAAKAAELIPAALEAQKVRDAAWKAHSAAAADLTEANEMPETTDAEKAAKETAVKAAEKALEAAYAEVVKACKALAVFTDDNEDDKKDGSLTVFMTELRKSYNPMAECYNSNYNYFYRGSYSETTENEEGEETTETVSYNCLYTWAMEDLLKSIEEKSAAWTDSIESWMVSLQNAANNYENWDAYVAEIKEAVAAKNEEIKAVDAANEAYNEAEEARVVAEEALNELNAKVKALNTLQANAVDIEYQISQLEENIALYKTYLASYQNEMDNAVAQIELQKDKIANLEAQIEYLEMLVESAKTALDAAISAQNAQ